MGAKSPFVSRLLTYGVIAALFFCYSPSLKTLLMGGAAVYGVERVIPGAAAKGMGLVKAGVKSNLVKDIASKTVDAVGGVVNTALEMGAEADDEPKPETKTQEPGTTEAKPAQAPAQTESPEGKPTPDLIIPDLQDAPKSTEAEKGMGKTEIGIMIAVAVVILAIVVVFCLKNRKDNKQDQSQDALGLADSGTSSKYQLGAYGEDGQTMNDLAASYGAMV